MQSFINLVYDFFIQIYQSIISWAGSYGYTTQFNEWLGKTIFNGDLITIGMTWKEALLFVLPTMATFFFIIFIFKLVFGVIKLICLR